jgi:hypothetical protein
MLVHSSRQRCMNGTLARTKFMLPAIGSIIRQASSGRAAANACSSCAMLLYSSTSVCCTTSGGTPALVGVAERGQARAGLDQQGVGMAVVAALELDQLVRPVAPRARRMALMAASVPELTRRTMSMDGTSAGWLRPVRLRARSGAPNEKPSSTALLHRLDHDRVAMAQDHRAPGADVVDVALALASQK